MQPVQYEGTAEDGKALQAARREAVRNAENAYRTALQKYQEAVSAKPRDETLAWAYAYDVDVPIVTPNLLQPSTVEEQQYRLEHIKVLANSVTRDLLETIEVSYY